MVKSTPLGLRPPQRSAHHPSGSSIFVVDNASDIVVRYLLVGVKNQVPSIRASDLPLSNHFEQTLVSVARQVRLADMPYAERPRLR